MISPSLDEVMEGPWICLVDQLLQHCMVRVSVDTSRGLQSPHSVPPEISSVAVERCCPVGDYCRPATAHHSSRASIALLKSGRN